MKITNPIPDALKQICEEDVCNWLAARVQQIRHDVPLHALSANLHILRSGEYDVTWTAHTPQTCVVSCPTSAEAVEQLVKELGEPAKLAKEKREEAARIIKQAEELELIVLGKHIATA